MTPDKQSKINPFDRLRVDPERSRRIKRIIFIIIIALLLVAFVLPLAMGY